MIEGAASYSVRIAYPQYLQRARDHVVRLPVYVGKSYARPASGTYTLYDTAGNALATGAVDVTEQVPKFALAAAAVPASLVLGYGYREEWELVMPDGTTRVFPRDVVLTRHALYPVLTDDDLIAVYSDLERLRPTRFDSFETYREEAWKRILGRLEARGNMPNLIVTPWSLREVHLDLALYLVTADLRTDARGRWGEIAESHKREFELGFARLRFQYENGADVDTQQPAEATLFSTAPPATSWWW